MIEHFFFVIENLLNACHIIILIKYSIQNLIEISFERKKISSKYVDNF